MAALKSGYRCMQTTEIQATKRENYKLFIYSFNLPSLWGLNVHSQVPYIILYDIDEKIDPGAAPTEPILHPFLSVLTHINSSPNHLAMDVIAWQKKSNDMRAEIEVIRLLMWG